MTAIHIEEGDWHSLKHECERVRLMVFVAEQKVPKDEELDEWDEASRHFVAKDERRMVLGCLDCCRPVRSGALPYCAPSESAASDARFSMRCCVRPRPQA